ncbi:MAG: hexose kinase [Chitinivibrionales bacterium]|nr:hexose kinase [Chitinivibrionales bacterium]MBD3358457.1 hexose kinase [Chitinivibrionales bacterium]
MIFSVLLNPAVDVIYELPELVPGSTMTDTPSVIHPAGKGINVAKAVRTLGEEVCVVGLIPGHDQGRFRQYLEYRRIGAEFFRVGGSARVNVTIAEQENGQVTHVSSIGPALSTRVQEEFFAFAESKMRAGDLWVLSGSLPAGFEGNAYRKLIERLGEHGATVMLDSRGKGLRLGLRARPAMVKPNHTELEAYFGEPIEGVRHIALKAKRLSDMGIEYVFVSLGSDGMIAVHDNDCLLCSSPPIEAVDTVGCGDALVAGVVVGYRRKFSFAETCRMAIACGASNAMHPGPGNVSLDEVWRLMEDVRVEAI